MFKYLRIAILTLSMYLYKINTSIVYCKSNHVAIRFWLDSHELMHLFNMHIMMAKNTRWLLVK